MREFWIFLLLIGNEMKNSKKEEKFADCNTAGELLWENGDGRKAGEWRGVERSKRLPSPSPLTILLLPFRQSYDQPTSL